MLSNLADAIRYMCVHVCVCVCACVCACVCMGGYIRACVYACMHAYKLLCACMRVHVWSCIVAAYRHVYVCVCTCQHASYYFASCLFCSQTNISFLLHLCSLYKLGTSILICQLPMFCLIVYLLQELGNAC